MEFIAISLWITEYEYRVGVHMFPLQMKAMIIRQLRCDAAKERKEIHIRPKKVCKKPRNILIINTVAVLFSFLIGNVEKKSTKSPDDGNEEEILVNTNGKLLPCVAPSSD